MKLPKWFPHPTSWASAVASLVFGIGVSVVFAFVMPILMELMHRSPRLAWLGMLLTWLAPIGAAAIIHRTVDAFLDLGGTKRAGGVPASGAASLWAGFVAWVAIIFVTMTTSFVMLVIDPPPVEPDAMWNVAAVMTRGVSGIVQIAVWIVIAAYVYEMERAARTTTTSA